MAFARTTSGRRATLAAAAVLAALTIVAAVKVTASAAPATVTRPSSLSASLESSDTAYPLTGTFGYTAHIRLDDPASYLQVRLQVRRPDGGLVYQRTHVSNGVAAGESSYTFGRELEGLELEPGVYPTVLSVDADIAGSTESTEVASQLLVYGTKQAPLPIVLVARVHAEPLSDPQGRFAVDPALVTQREDVERIAQLVLSDPLTRITVAIPPVTLEEWKRITSGYNTVDGRAVPPTDPTPLAYAATLTTLTDAIGTGRLELVSLGYSDPDLTALSAEGLADDTSAQYEAGISAVFASLETTPSTGTVPAGDCVPSTTLPALAENGIGYVVTASPCARLGKKAAPTGAYFVDGTRLTAIVTDEPSGAGLSSGETSEALHRSFNRYISAGKNPQPFAIRIDVGLARGNTTDTVAAAVGAFEREPWARLALGRDTLVPGRAAAVKLEAAADRSEAPADFWYTVRSARKYAAAMLAALGPGDPAAASADSNSLLAESSAWSEPLGQWGFADRGLEFANEARSVSRAILDNVSIKAMPVTLAGAKGRVPVTITNGTNRTLSVVLRTRTSGGVEVVGDDDVPTVLRPQETFVEIPVDMKSAISGKLRVEVLAGDLAIAHSTVEVHASYLDRLAIVGGIVLVLGIMLAFIITRVRRADRSDGPSHRRGNADGDAPRYTDASTTTEDESES